MDIVVITTPVSGTQACVCFCIQSCQAQNLGSGSLVLSGPSQTDNNSEGQRKEYATNAAMLGREAEKNHISDTPDLRLRFK